MDLPIESIRRDGGTQLREGAHEDTITDYAKAMKAGAVFPPVIVFQDAEGTWLADGFQRIEARQRAGFRTIDAEVREEYQGERGKRAAADRVRKELDSERFAAKKVLSAICRNKPLK